MISFGKIPVQTQFSCSCLVLFTSSVGCFDLPAIIVPLPDREGVCQPDYRLLLPPLLWPGLGQLWAPLACVYICIRLKWGKAFRKSPETGRDILERGVERGWGRQRYSIDTSFALAALNGSRCSPNASALMRILWLTWLSRWPYLWLRRRQRGRERQREDSNCSWGV